MKTIQACLASTDRLSSKCYCATITKTLLEGLSVRPRKKQVKLGAPKIMSVDGIYAGEFSFTQFISAFSIAESAAWYSSVREVILPCLCEY